MSAISVDVTANTTDLNVQLALMRAEVSTSVSALNSLAKQAQAAGGEIDDGLKVQLSNAATAAAKARAEMNALNAQVKALAASSNGSVGLKASFEEALAPLTHIRETLAGIAEVALAAFAVERISDWASEVAEAGAHMMHLAQQTGLSVEDISTLAVASKAMGMGVDEAANMVDRLEKNMAEAQNPTSKQAAAFAALGISAKSLKDLSIDQVLNKIADAFHNTADGPDKTALAMELMGRAGAQMIPLLDQGSVGLANFKKMAEESGTVLTGPMAEGMEKTVLGITGLKMAAQGVGISLFELFKPAIDAVVTGLTEMIVAINNSIRTGGIMSDVVKVAVAGFNALVLAVTTARAAVEEFYLAGVTAYKAIADAMHGDFSKAQKDIVAGYESMKAAALDYFHTASNLVTNAGSDLGAQGGPEGAKKPKLNSSGLAGGHTKEKSDYYAQWKEELQQQLLDLKLFGKDAEGYELDFWQSKLREAQAGGKNYVGAVRQITGEVYSLESRADSQAKADAKKALEDAKRARDQDFQNFKAQIDLKREAAAGNVEGQIRLDQLLVDKAKQLYGQDSTNALEAMKKKVEDIKLQIDKMMEPVKKAADKIASTFDQMFRGMLEGTQTFGQAMRRLALQLIEDFASMAIKSTETWILNQIRQTMSTEQNQAQQVAAVAAGQEAQNAAKMAGQAEGRAAEAAEGSKTVLNDSYEAMAGAYKAVVGIPVVGPILAPIAAAGAGAAVMAFDVFSASGGFDIPAGVDPITQLHQQEMVLPANLAERVRNMTDPVGPPQPRLPAVNLQINTMDSASFFQNISTVRREVAKLVAQQWEMNPSLRPGY